jgi:2-polyprenyl-3-methyl-5-hydroxy-6-metoxy-1,4-benzoquinol methylase
LYFVSKPAAVIAHAEQAADEMERLAARARELALVEPVVEESETPWRAITARERLADLQRFIQHGRLLEIGCSTGEVLLAAQSAFTVTGVEADAQTSAVARARGLACHTGTLSDAQFAATSFDVIALYHVIEHLPSPQAAVAECARLLAPGGWLVLEAPNIQTIWFRWLGARWRQFIPDHLFFFTPATLQRLCEQNGFAVRECGSVGKAMSVRLFISRLSRYSPRLARGLSAASRALRLDERTVRLKLGDVMRLYAQKN